MIMSTSSISLETAVTQPSVIGSKRAGKNNQAMKYDIKRLRATAERRSRLAASLYQQNPMPTQSSFPNGNISAFHHSINNERKQAIAQQRRILDEKHIPTPRNPIVGYAAVSNEASVQSSVKVRDSVSVHVSLPRNSNVINAPTVKQRLYSMENMQWKEINENIQNKLYIECKNPNTYVSLFANTEIACEHLCSIVYSESLPHLHKDKNVPNKKGALSMLDKMKIKVTNARKLFKQNPMDSKVRQKFFHLLKLRKIIKLRENENKEMKFSERESKKFDKNPMEYVKQKILTDAKTVEPTFDEKKCFDFFVNTYTDNKRCEVKYETPSWLPNAPSCNLLFNNDEINELELKNVLSTRKTKSSPGPDGIPYCIWKNLPCTYPYLLSIYNTCLKDCTIPDSWKKGIIKLFWKSGDCSQPANFRPICLTNAIGKIFSVVMLNRLRKFAITNKVIDTSIQKGFLKMPGCIEHIYSVEAAILATKKNLVGCLVDIANAYGSVKHAYIIHVLQRYQFPIGFQRLIANWYTNMCVSVQTKNWITKPIPYEIGVFQGDPLSVGIFLLCMNPLFELLKTDDMQKYAFCFDKLLPKANMLATGFADDVGIFTRSTKSCQKVLDNVDRFMDWAGFTMKINKCKALAVRRTKRNEQFKPTLFIKGKEVPACQPGETVRFLGKELFMSKTLLERHLEKKLDDVLVRIDDLQVRSNQKLFSYSLALPWSFTWVLSIIDISESFLEKLDRRASNFLRRWAGLAQCASSSILYLPKNLCGLNIPTLATLHKTARTSFFGCINRSKDESIQTRISVVKENKVTKWMPFLLNHYQKRPTDEEKIDHEEKKQAQNVHNNEQKDEKKEMKEREYKHREHKDSKEVRGESKRSIAKAIREQDANRRIAELQSKQWQGAIVRSMAKTDVAWTSAWTNLSPSLLRFATNSLVSTLPSRNNLKRWKLTNCEDCPLCENVLHEKRPQTIMHVLSNCPVALNTKRYSWRHNCVLSVITDFLMSHKPSNISLLVDLSHHNNNYQLVPSYIADTQMRPDILLVNKSRKKVLALELTCPDEQNVAAAHAAKVSKYAQFKQDAQKKGWSATISAFEVSTRGLHNGSLRQSLALAQQFFLSSSQTTWSKKHENELHYKCSTTVLHSSYVIWLSRSFNNFASPETLKC